MNSTLKREKFAYFLLMLPTLIAVVILIIVPIFSVIGLSLYKYSLVTPWMNKFIGLQNYVQMLNDGRFWNSLRVALILGTSTVTLQVLFGFLLAMLLSKGYRALINTRAVFLLPMTVPPIVASIIWKLLFTPTVPGINYLLSLVGVKGPSWFDSPELALAAITIANVWQWTPFVMLILLAAIESLPEDPYEQALIDGASGWQTTFYITIPMLRPTIFFVATYRAIESLKIFPLVYVMTGGGPGTSTEPINYYAYATAFKYNKMGYGSALVVSMAIIVAVVVLILRKAARVESAQ